MLSTPFPPDIDRKVYTILIVEDCLADFELYRHFLKKDDAYAYEVRHVESGAAALESILDGKPSLVLVDFSLPDMDGLALIEAIRRMYCARELPLVMLTGQGSETIAIDAMKHDIEDYLIKDELDCKSFLGVIHDTISAIERERPPRQLPTEDNEVEILIVDDSEADIELYARFLQQDKTICYHVSRAETAAEALAQVAVKAFDVVLTDYELPDSNGLALIQAIHEIVDRDLLCTILMTGQGSESLVVSAMKGGASDYLVKSWIDPERLRKAIADNLAKVRLQQQLSRTQYQKNLLSKIGLSIRKTLEFDDVVRTAVREIKRLIPCDRALIYRLNHSGNGQVVAEAREASVSPTLELSITDTFFKDSANRSEYVKSCASSAIDNIDTANIDPCHYEFLRGLQVRSYLAVPIALNDRPDPLWGLLILHHCQRAHTWKEDEITLLREVAQQIAIGVTQSLLVQELRVERDRANKAMQAKSDFLANMSHEIRTPMMGVLGMADLLMTCDLSADVRDYVEVIHSSGNTLLTLINDILNLSKLEAGKVELRQERFSLDTLLHDTGSMFGAAASQKGLALHIDVAADCQGHFLGDPDRLKQVFTNLIGNAIKFTQAGRVEVSVRREARPESLARLPEAAAREMVLYCSVQDTGIGIDRDAQERLFQPFEQVDISASKSYEGTGLGLSICQRLVHLMGGKVGVKSRAGEGSTFWFAIPLASADSNPTPLRDDINYDEMNTLEMPQQQEATIPRKGTILLAEDNSINRKVIVHQLACLNYDCIVVENGAEAIEMSQQGDNYMLILMDCQMPVVDGYQATQEIRKSPLTESVPIIGLTAYSMEGDREKCLAAGMNDYLSKPCSIAQIQEVLDRWI